MKQTHGRTKLNNPVKVVNGTSGLDHVEEISASISQRAYELFENGGRIPGRELDHWFRAEAELLHPVHVEIAETDDALTICAEIFGFSPEQVEVSVSPRHVTIMGKREAREQHKSGKTVYAERCADRVFRTFELPVEINTSKSTATLKDGVLEVALPKVTGAAKARTAAHSA